MINRDEIQKSATNLAHRDDMRDLIEVASVAITNDAEKVYAAGLVVRIKRAHKQIDAVRDEFLTPLKEARAWVDAQFDPLRIQMKNAEDILKEMIGSYAQRQLVEQRRLAAKAAEMAPKAVTREAFVQAMETVKQAAPVKVEGVSTRPVWKFEVTDAALVPREFCSPDVTKLRAAVGDGAREIPGVRIFEEQVVVVRT